jgi:RNA polymerase sigma factor (sigma-70 family)
LNHPSSNHPFVTTQWSIVLSAANDDCAGLQALETLCKAYWGPVYVFVRTRGYSPEDAKDLTQGFFARIIEKRDFGSADPGRGRFRTYLLGAVKHYLSNQKANQASKKRGGEFDFFAMDGLDPEIRYQVEAEREMESDVRFDLEWAKETVNRALSCLRSEYVDLGKANHFDRLKGFLAGHEVARDKLAADLEMTEGTLKVAIHRLRKRYRVQLEQQISQTIGISEDLQVEMRHLLAALLQQ